MTYMINVLSLLVSLFVSNPEVVAEYNAHLTLHMVRVYGAKVSCVPFDEDPKDQWLYHCKADTDEMAIRLYCKSDQKGAGLCKNYFVVFK